MKSDLCIGCGICAAICPQKNLRMQFNNSGEYTPSKITNCSNECGLCLKVCPFNDQNENETELGKNLYGNINGVNYLPETGYYLNSYVGYSEKFRQSSASGGMTTWLLTTLLKKNIVDHVICITSKTDPEKLFSFEIFDDENSIIGSSGSAYYPVEISQVIQRVLEKPGRYAITGLPCFLKAIRLAAQKNSKLKERIKLTIGLVCGQMKSKHYTTYLSTLAKTEGKLQKVYYRGKSPDKPASNFYFCCTNENGVKGKIFWNEGVSEAWVNRWFTPNACNYCDDVFSELADVVFMDAWLPEYSKDSRGTNLIIVRSPLIDKLFLDGIKNEEINIENISINKVIQSQAGVIDLKRTQLSYRLYLAKKNGLKVPQKRVEASEKIGILKKQEIKIKARMQEKSKTIFLDCYINHILDSEMIIEKMNPELKRTKLLKSFIRFGFPIRVIKRINMNKRNKK